MTTLAFYDCQYPCNHGSQVWITGHSSCPGVVETLWRSGHQEYVKLFRLKLWLDSSYKFSVWQCKWKCDVIPSVKHFYLQHLCVSPNLRFLPCDSFIHSVFPFSHCSHSLRFIQLTTFFTATIRMSCAYTKSPSILARFNKQLLLVELMVHKRDNEVVYLYSFDIVFVRIWLILVLICWKVHPCLFLIFTQKAFENPVIGFNFTS